MCGIAVEAVAEAADGVDSATMRRGGRDAIMRADTPAGIHGRNTRARIDRQAFNAGIRAMPDWPEDDFSPNGMLENIGCGFGNGSGNLAGDGLVEARDPCQIDTRPSRGRDLTRLECCKYSLSTRCCRSCGQ